MYSYRYLNNVLSWKDILSTRRFFFNTNYFIGHFFISHNFVYASFQVFGRCRLCLIFEYYERSGQFQIEDEIEIKHCGLFPKFPVLVKLINHH